MIRIKVRFRKHWHPVIMLILEYFKPTLSFPYPNGPLSDKISSKAIELVNAEVERVSYLSKEQDTHTYTCMCKLFCLLATNHVSVRSYTKYMQW